MSFSPLAEFIMRKILISALFATAASSPALAVQSDGFSLTTSQGFEDRSGYVWMRDGQVYSICLSSSRAERADVELSLDGLRIGVFRLNAFGAFCVERPEGAHGRFAFFRSDSSGGLLAGSGAVSYGQRGLVTARFIPEDRWSPYGSYGSAYGGYAGPGYGGAFAATSPAYTQPSGGVSGLVGVSDQEFNQVAPLWRNYAGAVTLGLRLAHDPRLDPPPAPIATSYPPAGIGTYPILPAAAPSYVYTRHACASPCVAVWRPTQIGWR